LVGTGVHPTNEANTRSWIIRPLLEQCGYNRYEISEEEHNGNNQFPDYTILPNTPHTWYLEAKSWTHTLHTHDANQALNYANTQGKRWVVLSNGRIWQLYDGHLVAVPTPQRLMSVARLEHPGELEAFLKALHKPSLVSNGVVQFALDSRLTELLREELANAESELIKTITTYLRGHSGLSGVTSSAVATWFKKPTVHLSPVSIVAPAPSKSTVSVKSGDTQSLAALVASPDKATGQIPQEIILPDGTSQIARSWRDVAIAVIHWLYANQKTPTLPFSGQAKGKRYLLNSSPDHSNIPMNEYKALTVQNQTIYLHTNRSARDFILCLSALCAHVGVSASDIKIRFQ